MFALDTSYTTLRNIIHWNMFQRKYPTFFLGGGGILSKKCESRFPNLARQEIYSRLTTDYSENLASDFSSAVFSEKSGKIPFLWKKSEKSGGKVPGIIFLKRVLSLFSIFRVRPFCDLLDPHRTVVAEQSMSKSDSN